MFYTGKSWIGQNRYRCTDKLTTCQLGLSSSAWQNHLRELAYRNYDFDRIRLAVVGGDGAEWVRNSFEGLGKPTIHLLDRFQPLFGLLGQALKAATDNDREKRAQAIAQLVEKSALFRQDPRAFLQRRAFSASVIDKVLTALELNKP